MPTWNPDQYLLFEEDRTLPVRDLVARIPMEHASTIIDLGCGPGTSTAVLAKRWPGASITGLDNSVEMLDHARSKYPSLHWIHGDIAEWAATTREQCDLVFSNAALHWIDDHASLYPALFARVAPGGAFAAQVPYNPTEPVHRILCDLESSNAWRPRLPATGVRRRVVDDPSFYYDLLASMARRIRLWETTYILVMPGVILSWNGSRERHCGRSLTPLQ